MWDVINERVRSGSTLLLTTQYLEEADRLADNIVVIDRGRAIARGTPDVLKRQVGGERLEVTVADGGDIDVVRRVLAEVGTESPTVDRELLKLEVPVAAGPKALMEVVRRLDSVGVEPADITTHRASLDDVFMALTGHATTTQPVEDPAAAIAGRDAERATR
jgi:ABC-2 type transport system ATP-binding protein